MQVLKGQQRHEIRIILNGRPATGYAEPRMLLSDFLRQELGATGTHVGCEHGVCGACTVIVDGAAVFDGAKDGVFVPALPLAGVKQFTIEILFSPAEGGPAEQRFFHLQDTAESRVMIETRLDGKGGWWLDTYLGTPKGGKPLIDPKRVHATNKFYWAAVSYDGSNMKHFINGEKELEASGVTFGPFTDAGKVSLGVRQNKVYWFKGAIREVRFTPAALPPEKLQRVK